MKFSQSLREQVDKGRAGQNWGLSMGLPKIEGIKSTCKTDLDKLYE